MKNYKHKVFETSEFLEKHIKKLPKVGLITGTGLGESSKFLDISVSFEYDDIPHFPTSTVARSDLPHTGDAGARC